MTINITNIYLDGKPFIDLTPFFESVTIKPLTNGQIVEHQGIKYRVERIFWHPRGKFWYEKHCYVFIDDQTPGRKKTHNPWAKKPSEIQQQINDKIIEEVP